MHDPLAPLLADGVIDEILNRLKSGKEADLWLVRHGHEVVAAKVYKERLTRSFKNDAAYKEGRQVRSSRTQRAMDKGSRFGQQAAEEAWKAKEADALHALHAAGVRVPRPVVFYEGVLLMELVLDPFGQPAPRLIDAHVTHEHAAPLYEDLRAQAVKMLCCDLIHGDLSPYNILAGRDGPVVIDFPQVIGAAHNSQAERFFQRDLDNLRRFFEPIDGSLRARAGDAREIWRAYMRRELTPDFVPTGRHVEPERHGRGGHDRPAHDRPAHGRSQERPRGAQPEGRPPHGRPPESRPPHGRPPEGQPAQERPRGAQPEGRPHHGRPEEPRPPQGPRANHRDRQDRREQREGSGRTDRRDQREQRGPARPPLGAGHSPPATHGSPGPAHPHRDGGRRSPDRPPRREPGQPEVVRVARPAAAPGTTAPPPPRPGPGQPGGRGPAAGQPGGREQGPRPGGGRGQGQQDQGGGHGQRRGGRRGRRR